jgi:hypothetical protein
MLQEDGKAHAAHAKAMKAAHKEELQWLEAQRRHELMQTELRVKAEAYEASREHAQRITELLQEKNREVEMLRLQKGADAVSRIPFSLPSSAIADVGFDSASERHESARSRAKYEDDAETAS